MVKFTYGLLLIIICFFGCGRRANVAELDSDSEKWKTKEFKPNGVETETDNNGIIIQNSFPRGDRYSDSNGKTYGVVIFWTRIINRSKKSVQLSINFQRDSLVNPAMGDIYSKLFLPPDTMTLDKDQLYGYGVTDLKSVLDNPVNVLTSLQRTIPPDHEYMFRVGMFSDRGARWTTASEQRDYVLRSALILKNQDLVYIIRANSDSTLVPFGKIAGAK